MTATLAPGPGLSTGSVWFPSSGDPQPTIDFVRQLKEVRRGLRKASEQLGRARREADDGWDGIASEAFLNHIDGRIEAINSVVYAMSSTIDPVATMSQTIMQTGSFYSRLAEVEMRLRQKGDASYNAAIQDAIDGQQRAVRSLLDHNESAAARMQPAIDQIRQETAGLVALPHMSAADLAASPAAPITFWDHVDDSLVGDAWNLWNGERDDSLPAGKIVTGLMGGWDMAKWVRLGQGLDALPTFNNGALARGIANLLWRFEATQIGGLWLSWPKMATPWFRYLGVAGGVVSTASGVVNLVKQGNPVKAFNANPAGYVADVASTAFSASSTAFLIAPNPVTAGAAVVTGVVWAGAEIVDHWDEIEEWGANTAEAVGDAWDSGVDAVADAGRAINQTMNEAWDSAIDFFTPKRGVSLGGWF